MSELRNCDLIFVDTSGRNPKQLSSVDDLEIFKNLGISVDFHLVVSCTDRPSFMEEVIKHFSKLSIQSLSFTKLDEYPGYADVFNASARWGLPVSFFSFAPKVPDGLERASRERVAERLFNI
jgi:flagellar biosynthesis protein FlhF